MTPYCPGLFNIRNGQSHHIVEINEDMKQQHQEGWLHRLIHLHCL